MRLSTSAISRSCQGALKRPSGDAFSHRGFADAELSRPISQTQRDASEGEPSGDRPIEVLFSLRGPAAVLWRVTGRVIDAFKGRAQRARAHVGQKVVESQPAVTDLDAFATVIRKHRIFGIAAAGQHPCPTSVFAGAAVCGMSVTGVHNFHNYPTVAA